MTDKKLTSYVQVYCPELKEMINPGEWTMCPFFKGKELNLSDTEDALKQIFRCHVQCGCEILYQYFEGDKLVTKTEESVEDQESLRRILSIVIKKPGEPEKEIKKSVLLVDDDPDFLEMHSAVLENKGFEVIAAKNSKECMDKLEKIQPDIVVLDVMMEQFDSGFKTSKRIKEKYKNLPVMLLTSIGAQTGLEFSSNTDILKETGADILLDKPVSPRVFIDEIKKLTEKK